MNATITLSGIELTASNLPLPDASTWFDWYYERNLDFSAEANTECSAVVTTSEVESIDATADANAVCSNVSTTASNLLLPDNSAWFDFYYERNLDFSASALTQPEGLQSEAVIETIEAVGDSLLELVGNELNSSIAEIDAVADGNQLLVGQDLTAELGEIVVSVTDQVNASVEITGVALVSFVGNVSTNVLDDEIIRLSGNPKRYSANQFKSGNVKLTGIQTKISTGNVKAIGVMSLSVRVALQNVELSAQIPTILANGVLSISDEEFLLLMAA